MAKRLAANRNALLDYYIQARFWIENSPFAREVEWQSSISLATVDETHFLREYGWVVFNSGFKESVVRRHFDYLSLSFCDWESAQEIVRQSDNCVSAAFQVFRHRRKLEAIIQTALLIDRNGFQWLMDHVEKDAISTLISLPYIGKVTAWHLAKNIGANVAKPDRHLVRIAHRFGYWDVNRMCAEIEAELGDSIAVADIVLWRFAEQSRQGLVSLAD